MEQPPNNFDKIEKETVLEMLRTNGFDHPETKELVLKQTEQREEEVEKDENPNRASIVFTIERTELYLATGDKDGAFQNLEDALDQADHEGDVELQNQIV